MKDTINSVLPGAVFNRLFAAVSIVVIFGCTTNVKIETEPIFIDPDSLIDAPDITVSTGT